MDPQRLRPIIWEWGEGRMNDQNKEKVNYFLFVWHKLDFESICTHVCWAETAVLKVDHSD